MMRPTYQTAEIYPVETRCCEVLERDRRVGPITVIVQNEALACEVRRREGGARWADLSINNDHVEMVWMFRNCRGVALVDTDQNVDIRWCPLPQARRKWRDVLDADHRANMGCEP